MTPEQLASSGSEHSQQRALFAWANMAERFGFDLASDPRLYEPGAVAQFLPGGVNAHIAYPVPELRWLHAIPNGGQRDKITAGKLKAEGVKKGVLDVFLPLPMHFEGRTVATERDGEFVILTRYCGLYLELKRPEKLKAGVRKPLIVDTAAGTLKDEQTEFVAYARGAGYAVSVCFDWYSATREIEMYIKEVRRNG